MAAGMEPAINNAEEAAVNAPFNSTGLQTPGQLFFCSRGFWMRGSYIRLYGFVCGCTAGSFPPTSIQFAEPLMVFHQGPALMEFPTSATRPDTRGEPWCHKEKNVHAESEYMNSI